MKEAEILRDRDRYRDRDRILFNPIRSRYRLRYRSRKCTIVQSNQVKMLELQIMKEGCYIFFKYGA